VVYSESEHKLSKQAEWLLDALFLICLHDLHLDPVEGGSISILLHTTQHHISEDSTL
jgi:hypothetical protein